MARKPHSLDEKPGLSPSNRSLERGIEILRAFRPGSETLGNAELAERAGLPRSTVSRLTQTLVGVGMLQMDPHLRGYRLAPAVLSLAHAMRSGSNVLQVAAPMMRALAERQGINVGLAAADRDEMVYLESIRYNRRVSLRTVVSGQRVPMELTSLGRAHLAAIDTKRREALLRVFKNRRTDWAMLSRDIKLSIESVAVKGYCVASWQPEVIALAAPLVVDETIYVVNLSLSTTEPMGSVETALAGYLLELVSGLQLAIDTAHNAEG